MHFIDDSLDAYVCQHTSPESDLLQRINRETHLEVLQPRMLSGHFQGRFLSMLSKMIHTEKILEIGTYTGYSALCLAEGLSSKGKIVTRKVGSKRPKSLILFILFNVNKHPPYLIQIHCKNSM